VEGAAASVPADHRGTVDVPSPRLPAALAELHRSLAPGAVVELTVTPRAVPPIGLDPVVVGAGFGPLDTRPRRDGVLVAMERLHTLADTVGPAMKVLVCGLNPSLHAADCGVGYAGPGNRFWPAAVAAGLVSEPFDPFVALADGVGMTDLVKRATPRAAEVTATEYRAGVERLDALVGWLQPRVVCIVGLDGWRRAVDRRARPGRQEITLGRRPVHLMPSTSGLNTHCSLAQLVGHLRAAMSTPAAESVRSNP
jgi:double-stranded uracil-DNA glycosylase